MHSNYNSLNNNNTHINSNLSNDGFNYFINGMKLLNPKWTVTENDGAQLPKTFTTNTPRNGSLHKTASFQTAANAASESAQYCNMMILQSQPYYHHLEEGHTRDYVTKQAHHYQLYRQHQQLHSQPQRLTEQRSSQHYKKTVHRKPNSPPPMVHQSSNKITRNNNNKHHSQSTQALNKIPMEHPKSKSSDSRSKTFSTDQHYQHYYSYYYNRLPEQQADRKTSRKLPKTFMASKKNSILETENKQTDLLKDPSIANYLIAVADSNREAHHHILKEKMPNNNVIQRYDDDEWRTHLNNVEVMNVTREFFDVKDIGEFDNKMHFTEVKEMQQPLGHHNQKRKFRIRSNSDTLDLSPNYNNTADGPWISSARNNNLQFDSAEVEQNEILPIQRQAKLPVTPHRVKAMGKKQSPPGHRVLLYQNQSPRLQRQSPSSGRLMELKHSRSKIPVVSSARGKERHCTAKQTENNNKADLEDNYELIKLVSPSKCQPTDRLNVKCDAGAYDDDDNFDDTVSNHSDTDFDDLDNVSEFGDGESGTSSDSENGYRSNAYKLSHSFDRVAANQSFLSSQSSEESLTNPDSLLVPSLFPNVPPYLAFSSNTKKGPDVPGELYRVLKWRVTNVMPKVVRCVLANSGMRLLKKTNDWMGTWGKHMKSPCFKTIRPYQKMNHLPGSFKIGRKDACWKNLQKQMNKHGKKDFGFMPKTYIIPHDLHSLRKNWPKYSQRNYKWIIKPPASARGAGIRVVNRWAQIPKRKPLIVQRYIERPLLINGSKFDLRLYVLVTSINPLRVFMYHNGLARFASVKYSDKADTLNDRCMHLTNYSINKFSSNYSKNEDVNACHGHKWTIKSLWTYLANRGIRTDFLWEALRNLVLRTILAGEQSINSMIKLNVESRYSCFELFGFDVLLDADLIPWLLEVNISPSLHSELPLDAHVKAPLVQGVLNTALFNVPPKISLERQKEIAVDMALPPGPICYDKRLYINYLSRAEKIKHNIFTRKTMEDRDEYIDAILDHLTPDDVRCLIIAEDELARSAPLERIFPTSETYKYLKYTDTPRYYNRLLDAWEARYSYNRDKGIALLRGYCEEKYHLEVPPSPAKKDSSVDRDPCYRADSEHSCFAAKQVEASPQADVQQAAEL